MKYLFSLFILSISAFTGYSQIFDFLKARAFDLQGKSDSALYYYNKMVDEKPNEKILILRGNLFLKNKQFDKALSDFNRAERFKPAVASFNLAKTYALLRDTTNAINFIRKNLASEYKVTASEIRMDPAFEFLQNNDRWKLLWQQDYYSKYDQQLGELRFVYNSGDWLSVINFVSDIAVKGSDIKHEMLAIRAKAYFEMGNKDAALEDYNNAIKTNKRTYQYFEGRADVKFSMDKYSEAELDYSQAIFLAPDIFELYKKRGVCRIEFKKYDLALDDANLIVSLFPNDLMAKEVSAKANFFSGRYLKALELYNNLISENNQSTDLYLFRARTYTKTGMVQNASKDYDRIIAKNSNHLIALRERGQLRFDNNDSKGACSDWLKAEKSGDVESANLRWLNCK